jgi:RNA polymerase sigma-70 factor, ECF subfamily
MRRDGTTGATPSFDRDDPESAVAAAQAGDGAAFAWLYRDAQPRLVRYAASLVGQDAEDVTAEAWSQIIRDLHGFSGNLDQFRGWASTIVRNRALDALRASDRRPIQAGDLADLFDLPHEVDAASTAVENLSTAAAIAMIASLPRDQAEAIMLRAIVGLDATTAARVLGKRPGAVRGAAFRGLKALHRRLEAQAVDEVKVTDA